MTRSNTALSIPSFATECITDVRLDYRTNTQLSFQGPTAQNLCLHCCAWGYQRGTWHWWQIAIWSPTQEYTWIPTEIILQYKNIVHLKQTVPPRKSSWLPVWLLSGLHTVWTVLKKCVLWSRNNQCCYCCAWEIRQISEFS